MKKVTKNDILLLVASKLPQPFPVEALTVAAWEFDKNKFGLAGYEQQYPHHNAVLCAIMGSNGLVKQGKLVRVSPGHYKVAKNRSAP